MENEKVPLKSSDGTVFEVRKAVADMMSQILNGDNVKVSTEAMGTLIESCNHHVDNKEFEKVEGLIKTWDEKFKKAVKDHVAVQTLALQKLNAGIEEAFQQVLMKVQKASKSDDNKSPQGQGPALQCSDGSQK